MRFLERGMKVVSVDRAPLDERLMKHLNLVEHIIADGSKVVVKREK